MVLDGGGVKAEWMDGSQTRVSKEVKFGFWSGVLDRLSVCKNPGITYLLTTHMETPPVYQRNNAALCHSFVATIQGYAPQQRLHIRRMSVLESYYERSRM